MIQLLVKYILAAAIKDRLFLGFFGMLAVGISLSLFFGSSIITEKDQFSLVFAAGGLRLVGVMTLILFIIFYMRRSFDTRDVEYMLSKPVSRLQFLIAHLLAFMVLAAVLTVLITTTVFLMPLNIPVDGIVLWSVSIFTELAIIAAVSLFFALVLSSAVTASMMVICFYVLSRLIGSILAVMANSLESGFMALMEKIMLVISVFIPRLDLVGQTSWLLYGAENSIDFGFIALQGGIFCGLFFAAAFFDLTRRQF